MDDAETERSPILVSSERTPEDANVVRIVFCEKDAQRVESIPPPLVWRQ